MGADESGAIVAGADVRAARAFVADSWERTVRRNTDDEADLIGLPHPYTVPSIDGAFQEMYYWDTYFTNEGLILDGRLEQAIANVENVASLIDRFGRMPNGNRTWFVNRSQPPFLAMMVERIHAETGDKAWLARMCSAVEREYRFWMTSRITPCGLNRYSHDGSRTEALDMVSTVAGRLGPRFAERLAGMSAGEVERLGSHHLAEAESGWDFTPRFDGRCEDFCPVDLNANLHRYELALARFAGELGDGSAADGWLRLAERRRRSLRRHCRDPQTGLFHDYDFVRRRRSTVHSAAAFSLLFGRAVSHDEATPVADAALARLEHRHGIVACEEAPNRYRHQWSHPNMWPPLVFLACTGLAGHGRDADARRLAAKFVDVVARNFATTGTLWEKYNAVDGSVAVNDEYPMPAMMGWTAGVFAWSVDLLERYRTAEGQ